MIPAYLTPLANHLWQSTLFAAMAGLLTLALRKNHAQARYGLWLAASWKFLFPFSVLVQAGRWLGWNPLGSAKSQAAVTYMAQQISQPFVSQTAHPIAVTAAPPADPLPALLLILWACGVAVVALNWWLRWRRLQAAARLASPLPLEGSGIRVMSSPALLEPGIFGIRRPVLLLPAGIVERLTPEQFEAILAHECCHVRRRDNLAAAIHMAVEAVFWFHPLVWWIEKQLVKERERACDEEVLRQGRDPEVYAEGILKVCRFYLESPLVCAAGVTGADLKKRIEEIMTRRISQNLNAGKKLLLAAAGLTAVAAPFVIGMMDAPRLRAQSQRLAFEVTSVKENKSDDPLRSGLQFLPGGRLVVRNLPLIVMVSIAYDVPFQSDRLAGGPDWIRRDRFDMEATAPKDAIPDGASVKVRNEKIRLMLQTLLAERFQMKIRSEMKELPVYAIVVPKGGPKLQQAAVAEKDCAESPTGPENPARCHSIDGGQGRGIHGQAVTLSDVASFVVGWTDRPVVDQTGLKGLYNIQTEGWVPMRPRPPLPPGQEPTSEDLAFADPTRPTLFQIFERLGLKLDQQRAPVEVFTIESAEKPSEN